MKIKEREVPTMRPIRRRSERVAMERDYQLLSCISSADFSDSDGSRSLRSHRVSFFSEYTDILSELVS